MTKNYVKLIGNLGQPPKSVKTDSSTFSVLNLAVSRRYFDKASKQWNDLTPSWFEVLVFNSKKLEKIKSFEKGDFLQIEGVLRTIKKEINGTNINQMIIVGQDIQKLEKFSGAGNDPEEVDFMSDEEPSWDGEVFPG